MEPGTQGHFLLTCKLQTSDDQLNITLSKNKVAVVEKGHYPQQSKLQRCQVDVLKAQSTTAITTVSSLVRKLLHKTRKLFSMLARDKTSVNNRLCTMVLKILHLVFTIQNIQSAMSTSTIYASDILIWGE